jgi:hypothetical protein
MSSPRKTPTRGSKGKGKARAEDTPPSGSKDRDFSTSVNIDSDEDVHRSDFIAADKQERKAKRSSSGTGYQRAAPQGSGRPSLAITTPTTTSNQARQGPRSPTKSPRTPTSRKKRNPEGEGAISSPTGLRSKISTGSPTKDGRQAQIYDSHPSSPSKHESSKGGVEKRLTRPPQAGTRGPREPMSSPTRDGKSGARREAGATRERRQLEGPRPMPPKGSPSKKRSSSRGPPVKLTVTPSQGNQQFVEGGRLQRANVAQEIPLEDRTRPRRGHRNQHPDDESDLDGGCQGCCTIS